MLILKQSFNQKKSKKLQVNKKDWLSLLLDNQLNIGEIRRKVNNSMLLFVDFFKDKLSILKVSLLILQLQKFMNYMRFYFKRRRFRQRLLWLLERPEWLLNAKDSMLNVFEKESLSKRSSDIVDLNLPIYQCIYLTIKSVLGYPQAAVYISSKHGRYLLNKLKRLGIICFMFQTLKFRRGLRSFSYVIPWNFDLYYPQIFLYRLSRFFFLRKRFLTFIYSRESKMVLNYEAKKIPKSFYFNQHLKEILFNYKMRKENAWREVNHGHIEAPVSRRAKRRIRKQNRKLLRPTQKGWLNKDFLTFLDLNLNTIFFKTNKQDKNNFLLKEAQLFDCFNFENCIYTFENLKYKINLF